MCAFVAMFNSYVQLSDGINIELGIEFVDHWAFFAPFREEHSVYSPVMKQWKITLKTGFSVGTSVF